MFPLPDPRSLLIYAMAAALLICGATAGVQTLRLSRAQLHLAQEQADRARETAERERVAREAEEKIARLQAEHAAATQELSDAYAKDLAARDAALADARADGDSLRQRIDAFAATGPAGAAPDPAACRRFADRAATLGKLLVGADRLAEKLAGAAERHASEVRILKRQIAADRSACEP